MLKICILRWLIYIKKKRKIQCCRQGVSADRPQLESQCGHRIFIVGAGKWITCSKVVTIPARRPDVTPEGMGK